MTTMREIVNNEHAYKTIDKSTWFSHILKVESDRFTDYKEDAGGPTKFGITLRSYKEYRKKRFGDDPEKILRFHIAGMKAEDAKGFYEYSYIDHPNLSLRALEYHKAIVVLDGAVLFGRARAAKMAQEATGALSKIDGIIGPVSAAAINTVPVGRWLARIQKARIEKHLNRIAEDDSQNKFLHGWLNRAAGLTEILDY